MTGFLAATPVQAAESHGNIIGAYSIQSKTATVTDPETAKETIGSLDRKKGIYLLDEKGNVFYQTPDGVIFQGGIAPDGYAYDENGVQRNTLTYIRDKYLEKFQELGDGDTIVFDSEKEERLFLQYYQLEYAIEQGKEIFYTYEADGKAAVRKGDISSMKSERGDAYNQKLAELAASLNACGTMDEKIEQGAELVSEVFQYDENYLLKDMNQAVKSKRGVCYHYVKLLHDAYEQAGIASEYMIGQFRTSEGVHAWLKVFNSDEQRYVYVDPTAMNQDRNGALFRYAIPAAYLDAYRPAAIS